MIRKIVRIDPGKCTGCGLCVPACAEGAIRIVGGKAVLAADNLCDGLGACLGECPEGAISVVEREAAPFDEEAVRGRICPGSRPLSLRPEEPAPSGGERPAAPSRLGHWPVQLALVPPRAPWLAGADLLVAAQCVPFSYAAFHEDFLKGRAVVTACPKLDDISAHAERLAALIRHNELASVTVARMEVPCCAGLLRAVAGARDASGRRTPLEEVVIGVRGDVLARRKL